MAGGAQGSGGRPAVNPQGAQQFQTALQGYRQAQANMPSQVPGANLAAPGGGMAAPAVMPQGPQMSQVMPQAPAPQAPQAPPQLSQPFPMAPQGGQTMPAPAPQLPPQYNPTSPQGQGPINPDPATVQALYQQAMAQQGQGMARPAVMPPQAPQVSRPMPMANDARFQQNPSMTPRPMPRPMPQGRPQVQGNPNAMPVQRSPRRSMMG